MADILAYRRRNLLLCGRHKRGDRVPGNTRPRLDPLNPAPMCSTSHPYTAIGAMVITITKCGGKQCGALSYLECCCCLQYRLPPAPQSLSVVDRSFRNGDICRS